MNRYTKKQAKNWSNLVFSDFYTKYIGFHHTYININLNKCFKNTTEA